MKIYKYILGKSIHEFHLPIGYQILCVQVQHNEPVVYIMINDKATGFENVVFLSYETGHSIPFADVEYVGTAMLDGGAYVTHIFKRK